MKRLQASVISILILSLAFGFLLALTPKAEAKRGGNAIVMFTANWCASCRKMAPIIQEVGIQNGLAPQLIDVDFQDAVSQASDYGLAIPTVDLPQVYAVVNGQVKLALDGRSLRYGQEEQARNAILNALQSLKR